MPVRRKDKGSVISVVIPTQDWEEDQNSRSLGSVGWDQLMGDFER